MEDNHTSSEVDGFCMVSKGGQSDHEDEVTGQLDNPNQTQPSTPQISEDCQVVFQNVSESYKPESNVPQEEDGESYQFCHIHSAGKMRGASTPFKFLEMPMVDYMEVSDESFESLMNLHNSEPVVKFTEERDNLSTEKALIEKNNQQVRKVEELEAALSVNKEKDKEFTSKVAGQFASSEQQREELRVEIDNLKHLVMEVNKQNQIILANQGANKEEKQKVEQQLLVASSDQNHKQMLGGHGKDWKSVLCDIFSSFI